MNFVGRAFLSFYNRRGNSLIMFLIYLIISTLVLSGFCVSQCTREAAVRIRKTIGADITIRNSNQAMLSVRGENTVPVESILQIREFSQTDRCSISVKGLAIPEGFPAQMTETQKTKFANWGSLSLYGDTYTEENPDFAEGRRTLREGGRFLNEKDTNACIMSYALGGRYSIGDEVNITAFLPDNHGVSIGKTVKLELVGLYDTTEDLIEDQSPELNPFNAIYTTPEVVMEMNEIAKVSEVTFHITDPEDCNSFIEDVQALPGMDENTIFLVDNQEYLNMRSVLVTVTGVAAALVTASVVLGSIVVILMTMNGMQDRKREVGVLLSIGEKKWKIIAQMILETIMAMVLAAAAAVPCANYVSVQLGNLISSQPIVVSVRPQAVLLMFFCGVGLTILASLIMVYQIIRYKPKQMLLETQ